ncbi:MAG: condensation domain-containing protein, partial [Cyanobacteria bacterium P01_F01_bin.150]
MLSKNRHSQQQDLSPAKRALLEKWKRGAFKADTIPCRDPQQTTVVQSFAQQRMWFLDQLHPNSPYYNVPFAYDLKGNVDINVLKQSVNRMVERHEVLRSYFTSIEGEPRQIVLPSLRVAPAVVDLCEWPEGDRQSKLEELVQTEIRTPFNLSQCPLIRVLLVQIDTDEYRLLFNIHHIVFDGWSIGIFIKELGQIYNSICHGQPTSLSELPIQYADFSLWQQQQLEGETTSKQLKYWKNQLSDSDFFLELPTDKPRPDVQTYRGDTQSLTLSKSLTQQLKALAHSEDCTLYMVLLSAFNTLLYRYSGQEDILVGTPVANRNRAEIEDLIGFFVNTLIMRTDLSGNPSFQTLLKRVREMTSAAYEHQDLPFEKIVDELQPDRDLSYQPITQVLFGLQNVPLDTIKLGDATLKPIAVDSGSARFDLILLIWEVEDRLTLFFEYSTDLFDSTTIERLQKHFKRLLEGIVAKPSEKILDVSLLSPTEQQQLLVDWQPSISDKSTDTELIRSFESEAQQNPQAIAITVGDQSVTYQQLNGQVNQLAAYLQTSGVNPGDIVGVYVASSIDWLVGTLATLKAGGVYLPLEATEPPELLSFKLGQSQPKVILTQQSLRSNLPDQKANVIELDSAWQTIQQQPSSDVAIRLSSEDISCLYYCGEQYTQVTYGDLNQRLTWLQREFSISDQDVFLCQGGRLLDCMVREVMLPLSQGARLIIAADRSSSEISRLIAAHNISIINFHPSTLSLFLSHTDHHFPTASLRLVWCGGEPLLSTIVSQFCRSFKVPLYYLHQAPQIFGELTVQTCHAEHPKKFVPMGRPAYRDIYVLDNRLNPVPVGIKGNVFLKSHGAPIQTPEPLKVPDRKQLLATGVLGRWLHDGTLESLGHKKRGFWNRGDYFNLDTIEAGLLESPDIKDCIVLVRETASNEQMLVAYVVLAGSANREQVGTHLQKYLSRWLLPSTWQFLSVLPINTQGQVDEQALTQMAIIDDDLVQRWQDSLQAVPQIKHVTVVKQDVPTDISPLHLSDVLPDWQIMLPSPENVHSDLPTGTQTSDRLDGELSINDGGPLPLETLPVQTLQDVLQRASQQA